MTVALLDRLTHRCQVLAFNGESYRIAGEPPPGGAGSRQRRQRRMTSDGRGGTRDGRQQGVVDHGFRPLARQQR